MDYSNFDRKCEYNGYKFTVNDLGGTMLEEEYIKLINILEEKSPKRICELGSGQSTLIFEKYCHSNSGKSFFSIEHDVNYATTSSIIFKLIEETSINIHGKTYYNCNKYDGFEDWLGKQDKFDLVLIDGPYGFNTAYTFSRVQVLSFVLLNKLQDRCVILYHDSQRINAKTTLYEFEVLLKDNGFKFSKEVLNENLERELTIYNITKIK